MKSDGVLSMRTAPIVRATASSRLPSIALSSWAVLANAAMFAHVAFGLAARTVHVAQEGLTTGQWSLMLGLMLLVGYLEGYRVLHHRVAPAIVARAHQASRRDGASVLDVVSAPFQALGLVRAPTRTLVRAWLCVVLHAPVIVGLRALAEPWRGIIDGAVATSLLFVVGSMLVRHVALLRQAEHAGGET